jgi:hypothetical protein
MNNVMKISTVVFTAFVLPGVVVAGECLTPAEATYSEEGETGYATQVQSDQGQGSIDCSNFIGIGGPMTSIQVDQDKFEATVDSPLLWSVPDEIDDNVDVVFIGNSDGARCTQFYSGNATSGYAGAGTKDNKDVTLVACTDGYTEELPELPEKPKAPDITEGGCDEEIQKAIDNNPNYDWVIAGGRNLASGEDGNTAICVDQSNTSNETFGMNRCVDRCITPSPDSDIPWYEPESTEYSTYCSDKGPFFPIECRVCALSEEKGVVSDYFDPETKFCWEQAQKATTVASEGFVNGSFRLPPSEQGGQGWKIQGYKGSKCYKISGTTQSGYPYSYWTPKGCP